MKTDLLYTDERGGKNKTNIYARAFSSFFRRSTVYNQHTSDAIKAYTVCVTTSLPVAIAGQVERDWMVVK